MTHGTKFEGGRLPQEGQWVQPVPGIAVTEKGKVTKVIKEAGHPVVVNVLSVRGARLVTTVGQLVRAKRPKLGFPMRYRELLEAEMEK